MAKKKTTDETVKTPEITEPATEETTEIAEKPSDEACGTCEDKVSNSDTDGPDIEDTALAGIDGDVAVVKSEIGLNLRQGPSLSFPVMEVLPDGAVVKVLELPYGVEVPFWALVHTGKWGGWVQCRYLQTLEPAAEV